MVSMPFIVRRLQHILSRARACAMGDMRSAAWELQVTRGVLGRWAA